MSNSITFLYCAQHQLKNLIRHFPYEFQLINQLFHNWDIIYYWRDDRIYENICRRELSSLKQSSSTYSRNETFLQWFSLKFLEVWSTTKQIFCNCNDADHYNTKAVGPEFYLLRPSFSLIQPKTRTAMCFLKQNPPSWGSCQISWALVMAAMYSVWRPSRWVLLKLCSSYASYGMSPACS